MEGALDGSTACDAGREAKMAIKGVRQGACVITLEFGTVRPPSENLELVPAYQSPFVSNYAPGDQDR